MNYNLDLEYSIIGTLITSFKQAIKYFDKTEPEYFFNSTNQEVFNKAKECYVGRKDFTEFTAIEHLKSIGLSEKAAVNHVLKCTENVITFYVLKSNLKDLEELYRKRELEILLSQALGSREDFDTNTDRLLQELYNLRKNSKKKQMKNMMTSVSEYVDFLQSKEDGNRCDTGFPLIDSMLKGMFKGQLIGLAARPGCGKSAFGANVALNVAKKGKKVAIFSQEMEAYELVERWMSNQTFIPMDNLITKFEGVPENIKDTAYYKIMHKANDLSKLPIYIADITKLTTADIRTECQQFKDLGLIVIDYLQLMMPVKKEQNRNLEIGQITRDLKILASELQCPILLLSQLNRVKDETDKPSLNDYRDSGAIEQDLVKSMMLWKINPEENIYGLTINKNRRGSTGDVELDFNGSYMMFREKGIHKEEKKRRGRGWSELE